MQQGLNPFMALMGLWQCVWFVAGPIVGVVIANKRGFHPVIGFVVGFLGCIGWAILFCIPSDKKTQSKQAGRSFSVDETPPQVDNK